MLIASLKLGESGFAASPLDEDDREHRGQAFDVVVVVVAACFVVVPVVAVAYGFVVAVGMLVGFAALGVRFALVLWPAWLQVHGSGILVVAL